MTISLNNLNRENFRMQEAFKTLRTNIGFCGDDIRIIAVTSTFPHEGKSEISLRLAFALAETGAKTILLDADIRNSVLSGRLKAKDINIGLTHVLANKRISFDEAISETDQPNLDIMFTGSTAPNPAELLGRPRFRTLLDHLSEKYEYIVIDCSPVIPVIDASIIAKQCDGTLIVIAQNSVRKRDVKKAIEQLKLSGTKILGTILNKVETEPKKYGYGYYGYGEKNMEGAE